MDVFTLSFVLTIKEKERENRMMEQNKLLIYMVTVVPGLEEIAGDELTSKFAGAKIVNQSRGKVFFQYHSSFEELYGLKCVDNLYLLLGTFHIGPHKEHLKELSTRIKELNVAEKLFFANTGEQKKIIVSSSRSGKHTYSRFDVADATLIALLQYYPFVKGTIEDHDIAFRIDVDGDKAWLYTKLTPAHFRFRGKNRQFLSGALKASVAHAMVWLSDPDSTDVFLDPFCGSGTIPFERSFYDAFAILASDISDERLQIARQNLPEYIGINRWDACHTELEDHSITKIVSNLPWGKQIQVDDIGTLYIDFLKEAKRILTADGKIVLLTDQESALEDAARINGFRIKKECTLSLHGLHPSIFLLKK